MFHPGNVSSEDTWAGDALLGKGDRGGDYIEGPADLTANLRVAWDDELLLSNEAGINHGGCVSVRFPHFAH
jgi:hypothetical protein